MEPNTEFTITIKKLMIDRGIENGHRIELLAKVSEKLGKPVHRNTLYNALSGYRAGAKAQEVLNALHDILIEMPDKQA
jgi:hypothetical protein